MLHFIQILYKKGKTVCCDRFNDEDQYRFNECYHGIHFFMDKTSLINWWNEYAKDNIPLKRVYNWKVIIHCYKDGAAGQNMVAAVSSQTGVKSVSGSWYSTNRNDRAAAGGSYLGIATWVGSNNVCHFSVSIKLKNGKVVTGSGRVWAENTGDTREFSGSYEMYP